MSDAPLSALAGECLAFARHVAGVQATPYQIEKYLALHRVHALAPSDDFDQTLLAFARRGGFALALADAWCGFFGRRSVVRAKLVAVLGILECSPPSFRVLDAPDPGGRAAIVTMALRGGAAGLTLVCAILLLLPIRLLRPARRKAT